MRNSIGKSAGYIGVFFAVAIASCHVTAQQMRQLSEQAKKSQEQHLLPSLFSELIGSSTLRPNEAEAVVPTNLGGIPKDASFDKRQVVVEVSYLTCDESDLTRLFDHVDRSGFELAGKFNMANGILFADKLRLGQTGTTALSATIRNAPATVGKISNEQRDSIIKWCKGTMTCDIVQAPTVTVFNDQSAVVTAAFSVRPIVVSVMAVEDADGNRVIEPVIRPIEEGSLLKIDASIAGDDIDLAATIVFNEIESVESFVLPATKAAGSTIQVPKCILQIVDTRARLHPNELLLIDTGMSRDRKHRVEKAASRLPVVGRLVSHEIEIVHRRVLMLLRATPVPVR